MKRDVSLHRCERDESRVLLRAFEFSKLLRDVATMLLSAIPNAFDESFRYSFASTMQALQGGQGGSNYYDMDEVYCQ
jgi:hypothetical protein